MKVLGTTDTRALINELHIPDKQKNDLLKIDTLRMGGGTLTSDKEYRLLKSLRQAKSVVGASHNLTVTMWAGQDASLGITRMAARDGYLGSHANEAGKGLKTLLNYFHVMKDIPGALKSLNEPLRPVIKTLADFEKHLHDSGQVGMEQELENHSGLMNAFGKDNKVGKIYDKFNNQLVGTLRRSWDKYTLNSVWEVQHEQFERALKLDPKDFEKTGTALTLRKNDISRANLKEAMQDMKESKEISDNDVSTIKDAKLRDNMRMVKYNSNMLGVPMGMQSLVATDSKLLNDFLGFYWGYHSRLMKGMWKSMDGLSNKSKISRLLLHNIIMYPTNLLMNAGMQAAYGINPMDHMKELFTVSMLGIYSRAATVAFALANKDNNAAMNSLVNPLITTGEQYVSTSKGLVGLGSKNQDEGFALWKSAMDSVPGGQTILSIGRAAKAMNS
jgi:hypothetical protein